MKRKIKYLIYRIKWLLLPYINFSTPVHIDLELSTKCNLNCKFCFRQEYEYKQQDIEADVFNKVVNEIHNWKIFSIKFNWRGEAVCHKNFMTIFEFFYRQDIFTELNTSLSQRFGNNELTVIAKYIDRLSISIDSVNPEIYEKIRKGASFHNTLYNLLLLHGYRETNKMPKIIINRRTSKLTKNESDEEFKSEFKASKFKFDIKPAQARNTKDIYTKQNKKNKYCGQPSRRLVIGVDGKVFTCCHAYKEQPELYLGNIKEQSLQEIWNSLKRALLVQSLKSGIYNNACRQCPLGGNE